MTYFFRLPKIKITEIEFEFGEQLKNSAWTENCEREREKKRTIEWTLLVNRKTEEPHKKYKKHTYNENIKKKIATIPVDFIVHNL